MSSTQALSGVPLSAVVDDATGRGPGRDGADALVVVAAAPLLEHAAPLGARVVRALEAALAADGALGRGVVRPPVAIPAEGVPGGRLIIAPVGRFADDTDDVRQIAEAAAAGVARAVDAGAVRPLLFVGAPGLRWGAAAPTGPASADRPKLARALEVAALAALGTRWTPLEAREAERAPRVAESVGVIGLSAERASTLLAIEAGRVLCRDITGTEPERMGPKQVAAWCEKAFEGTGVTVTTEDDVSGYPLLAAVARASERVVRHRPCVVRLEWRGSGPIARTVVIAGKGVTYDTGGADLKTDGAMAGMSRDKGGAGAAAGLVRAVAALRLPGVRVVALLGLVRNSIGEESFVSDEIIRARSGVRVRIGNTDAEGRLVLADLLHAAREIARGEPDPLILSLATLTGHVYRAYGPYIGQIGNAAARARGDLDALDALGELWGEPSERSRPRREDYAFITGRSSAEDVISSNRLASVSTPRGHQFPFAFLDVTSGLKEDAAVPFIHLDLAGVAVDPPDWQLGKPTGSPVATLVAHLAG